MCLNLLLLLKNEDRTGEKRLKNDNVMSDWFSRDKTIQKSYRRLSKSHNYFTR